MIGPKLVARDQLAFAGAPAADLRLIDTREYSDVGTICPIGLPSSPAKVHAEQSTPF